MLFLCIVVHNSIPLWAKGRHKSQIARMHCGYGEIRFTNMYNNNNDMVWYLGEKKSELYGTEHGTNGYMCSSLSFRFGSSRTHMFACAYFYVYGSPGGLSSRALRVNANASTLCISPSFRYCRRHRHSTVPFCCRHPSGNWCTQF